ncbi:MAG TPA: Sir2 family NAD-dependent protein deacetylase [Streptosporangiaceae bacterium]|nr:Sir2 family NAD-dependent protein deacetylase [Streptosporangiaceae bacterium]
MGRVDRAGGAGQADQAAELPAWARAARVAVVLTGAGISTDSGIPDFRGPQGLWTRNPGAERLSTYQAYVSDPAVRRRSWQARRHHPAWQAKPNPAHLALAGLARSGLVTAVITQNIDGLHQQGGTPADRVIELHGTMFSTVCVSCGDRSAMAAALARIDAGDDDPACARCGGILKSATVMFGQSLDPAVLGRAVQAATSCDLFLAVGSTLTVEPAASLCGLAVGAGAALVIVNRDPTPYDPLARDVVREPIGEAVPRIARQLTEARGRAAGAG